MVEAQFYKKLENGRVLCYLCPRYCEIGAGQTGFCFVRKNDGGTLFSLAYANPYAIHVDPIEKKPLSHFLPGTKILSIGTAGCNLGCKFCQNWDISKARYDQERAAVFTPEDAVRTALARDCPSIAFTYNDPVIWAEYAIDIAKLAHAHGLKTVMVTAGYITAEALPAVYEHMDAANVDLKGFTENFYRKTCLAHLEPVLQTLLALKRRATTWFEITNLVIPTLNDAREEARALCAWILDHLGPDGVALRLCRQYSHPRRQQHVLPVLQNAVGAARLASGARRPSARRPLPRLQPQHPFCDLSTLAARPHAGGRI